MALGLEDRHQQVAGVGMIVDHEHTRPRCRLRPTIAVGRRRRRGGGSTVVGAATLGAVHRVEEHAASWVPVTTTRKATKDWEKLYPEQRAN
jgi:hypothetical protein